MAQENKTDLRAQVNPTFQTAQQTLHMLAAAGNPDAKAYIAGMGIENGLMPGRASAGGAVSMSEADRKNLMVGATLGIEARYAAITRLLAESGCKSVLDIACGYTPRALTCFRSGYDYVGLDVPVVAEKMNQVADAVCGKKAHPVYVGGDATNAASVAAAADLLQGELFLTSEGLLQYLSKNELEQMIAAVCQVLKQHGGAWYSSDMEVRYERLSALNMDDPQGLAKFAQARDRLKKNTDIYFESSSFESTEAKLAFFEGCGLNVERLPFYTPDTQLNMLRATTPEKAEKLKALMQSFCVWRMTCKQDGPRLETRKAAAGLQIDCRTEGEAVTLQLTGRVDTLSAPELLAAFEELCAKQTVRSVRIEAEALEYISSAGLRVLMIMVKKLGEHSVSLHHATEMVREVFETTGFDGLVDLV